MYGYPSNPPFDTTAQLIQAEKTPTLYNKPDVMKARIQGKCSTLCCNTGGAQHGIEVKVI
jgi:hypothetical protein